jgi:ABC-type antimicrobial peptide transport system permease subunit
VLRESIVIASAGIVLGVPVSLVATRALSGLVFGTGLPHLVVVAACSMAMMAVAIVAGYLPARRASRVDPIAVLRGE